MKKTLFTLVVDGFSPAITDLTFPFMRQYAAKIGATFHVITERRYPDWPVVYEKLQIHRLGREMQNDWNIFFDADALVHPDLFDLTEHVAKDTVFHHGTDPASIRWTYDDYFRRDGRNIGSCNWCTMASDWCLDLWQPTEQTLEEALSHIHPTLHERSTVITPSHLIDDYTLSRNIARFGLKVTTFAQVCDRIGQHGARAFWHEYTIAPEKKVADLVKVIEKWKLA